MKNRNRLAVVGLALTLTAGCSPADGPASTNRPAQGAGATTAGATEDPGTPASGPRLNAALLAAVTYIRLWARPTLNHDAWYAGVRPVVTPAYAQLLADTDPAHVPAHGVTGSPHLISATTAVVIADVPTDAGPITVTVTNTDGRWLIGSARPDTTP